VYGIAVHNRCRIVGLLRCGKVSNYTCIVVYTPNFGKREAANKCGSYSEEEDFFHGFIF
jgi:hypothetical protein